MVERFTLTEHAWRAKDELWRCLQDFPLYEIGQKTDVKEAAGFLVATYATTPPPHFGTTHFQLQLTQDMCYLLAFGIAKPHRRDECVAPEQRPHYGTLLYRCIEDFCRTEGVSVIRTTPSGQGTKFFPRMGFTPIGGSYEAEKQLLQSAHVLQEFDK